MAIKQYKIVAIEHDDKRNEVELTSEMIEPAIDLYEEAWSREAIADYELYILNPFNGTWEKSTADEVYMHLEQKAYITKQEQGD